MIRRPPRSTLFPYTDALPICVLVIEAVPRLPTPSGCVASSTAEPFGGSARRNLPSLPNPDRKSTRLNSSHGYISYAVFCLKKKNAPVRRLQIIVAEHGHLTCS